jgi:hypothetical protein
MKTEQITRILIALAVMVFAIDNPVSDIESAPVKWCEVVDTTTYVENWTCEDSIRAMIRQFGHFEFLQLTHKYPDSMGYKLSVCSMRKMGI